jgi:hypothetical protein
MNDSEELARKNREVDVHRDYRLSFNASAERLRELLRPGCLRLRNLEACRIPQWEREKLVTAGGHAIFDQTGFRLHSARGAAQNRGEWDALSWGGIGRPLSVWW